MCLRARFLQLFWPNQTRSGFLPIGGRSTAIRLFRPSKPIITQNAIQPHPQSAPSDVVFVYASHPLTAATKEALNTLGEVKWLVTPDGEHGMYIQEYVDHFPGAQWASSFINKRSLIIHPGS